MGASQMRRNCKGSSSTTLGDSALQTQESLRSKEFALCSSTAWTAMSAPGQLSCLCSKSPGCMSAAHTLLSNGIWKLQRIPWFWSQSTRQLGSNITLAGHFLYIFFNICIMSGFLHSSSSLL